MKRLLVVLSLILFSCNNDSYEVKDSEKIFIEKTKLGYDIYSGKGELILEFTNRNCDSLSLSTLEYVFDVAKEFNNSNK